MSRVIFINTLYYPDFQESLRLDEIQTYLAKYNAELEYLSRDFGETKAKIFKHNSHKNMRERLHIVREEDCQK